MTRFLFSLISNSEDLESKSSLITEDIQEDEEALNAVAEADPLSKEEVDALVEAYGVEKTMNALKKCRVVRLRNLARGYDDFGIAGREISKANKTMLLEGFEKHYSGSAQ